MTPFVIVGLARGNVKKMTHDEHALPIPRGEAERRFVLIRLQVELLRRGMSQRELAERAHVNEASVSRICHGREAAYPERGRRIAVALGWTGDPEGLFEEVDA